MRAAVIVTALGTALLLTATSAVALGFGPITNTTQLGQALNFGAVVRLDADETLARECVSAEVFSGDNKLPAGLVRTAVEGAADANQRNVRITTTTLIDEPVVTVSITLGCIAKVTRRFVAFIDPPVINLAQAAQTDTPAAPGRARGLANNCTRSAGVRRGRHEPSLPRTADAGFSPAPASATRRASASRPGSRCG